MAIRAFIAQSACNEVIAGDCHARRPVSRPVFTQPMFCCGVLAILLLMTVLRRDEFWFQWNHSWVARSDNDRRDNGMEIGDGAIFMLFSIAVITVNLA